MGKTKRGKKKGQGGKQRKRERGKAKGRVEQKTKGSKGGADEWLVAPMS